MRSRTGNWARRSVTSMRRHPIDPGAQPARSSARVSRSTRSCAGAPSIAASKRSASSRVSMLDAVAVPAAGGHRRRDRLVALGDHDSAAALPLGGVLRGVGRAKQVGGTGAGPQLRHAGGERERLVALRQRVAGVGCDRGGDRGTRALDHHAELVPAHPVDVSPDRACGARQRVRGAPQRAVARGVPERVVDQLEPVDIAERDRDLGCRVRRPARAVRRARGGYRGR